MAKRLIRWALATAVIAASIILISGRWQDPWLWGVVAVWCAMSGHAIASMDDDLARERFSPADPGADRLSLRIVRLVALGHLVVSALDLRLGLGPAVPPSVRGVALAGMAAGYALVFRAMRENHFFSAVVRVQSERGHHVVTTGPYRTVRHPGYAGMIVAVPLGGLALGSWLGAGVAIIYSALILRRVVFEDAFLRRSLAGYDGYVNRVPYRLVPGIW